MLLSRSDLSLGLLLAALQAVWWYLHRRHRHRSKARIPQPSESRRVQNSKNKTGKKRQSNGLKSSQICLKTAGCRLWVPIISRCSYIAAVTRGGTFYIRTCYSFYPHHLHTLHTAVAAAIMPDLISAWSGSFSASTYGFPESKTSCRILDWLLLIDLQDKWTEIKVLKICLKKPW